VAEDDDFEVLRGARPEPQEEQLQDALNRDVNNRQNHGTSDNTTRGAILCRSNYRTLQVVRFLRCDVGVKDPAVNRALATALLCDELK
jgi:hypothetical protein